MWFFDVIFNKLKIVKEIFFLKSSKNYNYNGILFTQNPFVWGKF